MSKNNDSYSTNKDGKSSKMIIISKKGLNSAKERVDFTLKEGDHKLTVQMDNQKLNQKKINEVVTTMKNNFLYNSQSYGILQENDNLNTYLKKKNVLKSLNRKTPIKIMNADTTRNLIQSVEKSKTSKDDENNNNKSEIITPNRKKNILFKNIKIHNKKSDNIDNITNIIINDNEMTISIDAKDDKKIIVNDKKNKISGEIIRINEMPDGGKISRNYFAMAKNNNKKDEKGYEYKSEEIKQVNSSTSRVYESVKNNNFMDKFNQRSDRAAKSISDHDADKNPRIVSKLILDSGNNYKETQCQRLITENEESIKGSDKNKNEKNESKSSKTIKIDENDESDEDEKLKIDQNNMNNFNKNLNIYNLNIESNNVNKLKIIDDDKEKENSSKENNEKDRALKPASILPIHKTNTVYKICALCEHIFPMQKLFLPECGRHYLCNRCAKNYYEDKIENGIKEMKCPFLNCQKPVDLEDLKKIISKEHFNILCEHNLNGITDTQNKFIYTKIKTNINKDNFELYTKKNVIDISSNKSFFNYTNAKGVYCPNCYKDAIFSKNNSHFFKCLNCYCKRCKYCFKDFDDKHMDINTANHCKVYYRFEDEENKTNKFYEILLQIFFVIASYYICFAGSFLMFRKLFFFIFRAKSTGNIIQFIIAYIFALIFFFLSIPFLVVFYPFFPSIMMVTDYR